MGSSARQGRKKMTTRKHQCSVVIKWTGGFSLLRCDEKWKTRIRSETYRVLTLLPVILQLHGAARAVVEETDCANKSTGGSWPIVRCQLQSSAGTAFVIRALGLRNKQPEEASQTQSALCLKPHLILPHTFIENGVKQTGGSYSGW